MADPGPHPLMLVGKLDRFPAALEIDAHRDHAGDPRRGGLGHDRPRIIQLLEVEVSVYEDSGRSSSTTSSRRLNRGSGTGSLRPASSADGTQRISLG